MDYVLSVVGSNKFTEYHIFEKVMNSITQDNGKPSKILSIGRRGACNVAQRWAYIRDIDFKYLNSNQLDQFFGADIILTIPHEGDSWTEAFIEKAEEKGLNCVVHKV